MSNGTETETRSIDQAISVCDSYIDEHRRQSTRILSILALVSLGVVTLLAVFIWLQVRATPVSIQSSDMTGASISVSSTFTSSVIFALLAIFTIVFGVVMSVYRFHLNEISKAEHYKVGFLRIRIAANNLGDGFQGEVRRALTEHAFAFEPTSSGLISRGKKVESPLPGHPASDLSAIVLTKLLDGLDLRVEKRPS